MSRFTEYLTRQGVVLKAEIEALRARLTDSGTKGAAFEVAVAEFFANHYPAWFVATRSQIIDSFDSISGEVDVAVCNNDQPLNQKINATLIAEGIDFVAQVKARLSDDELVRAYNNCASVKRLKLKHGKGDGLFCADFLNRELLHQIPYIVFAFSCNMAESRLMARLRELSSGATRLDDPDAIVVLDEGKLIVNLRNGDAYIQMTSQSRGVLAGWAMCQYGESVLAHTLGFVTSIPRKVRLLRPITHYAALPPPDEVKQITGE